MSICIKIQNKPGHLHVSESEFSFVSLQWHLALTRMKTAARVPCRRKTLRLSPTVASVLGRTALWTWLALSPPHPPSPLPLQPPPPLPPPLAPAVWTCLAQSLCLILA